MRCKSRLPLTGIWSSQNPPPPNLAALLNQTMCGTICFNPDIEKFCFAAGCACPTAWDCVLGGCCPRNRKPWGTMSYYDPDSITCCHGAEIVCDKIAEICMDSGCCPILYESCRSVANGNTKPEGTAAGTGSATSDLTAVVASTIDSDMESTMISSQGIRRLQTMPLRGRR